MYREDSDVLRDLPDDVMYALDSITWEQDRRLTPRQSRRPAITPDETDTRTMNVIDKLEALRRAADRASAALAAEEAKRDKWGTEPAAGSVVVFTRNLAKLSPVRYQTVAISSDDRGVPLPRRVLGRQVYTYAALRAFGSWYVTGRETKAFSWVELNEFADEGTMRVAVDWSWNVGDAEPIPVMAESIPVADSGIHAFLFDPKVMLPLDLAWTTDDRERLVPRTVDPNSPMRYLRTSAEAAYYEVRWAGSSEDPHTEDGAWEVASVLRRNGSTGSFSVKDRSFHGPDARARAEQSCRDLTRNARKQARRLGFTSS